MNNFGVMFHHFHDGVKHIKSQGSICGDELKRMIFFLKNDYEIVDADVFFYKAITNELHHNQICLTFDDALACQYDIAYPILKEMGITAFWFLYTSIYKGIIEKLEVYRHFRFSSFDSIDSFYDLFFKTAILNKDYTGIDIEKELKHFNPDSYLQHASFYSDLDKTFRYTRDYVLGKENYYLVMDKMIEEHAYDVLSNKSSLWITEEQVVNLHKNNHIVGLHSHTHPTAMATKPYEEQLAEYSENKTTLEKIVQSKVSSVSYPCNSYNCDTDKIMNNL